MSSFCNASIKSLHLRIRVLHCGGVVGMVGEAVFGGKGPE